MQEQQQENLSLKQENIEYVPWGNTAAVTPLSLRRMTSKLKQLLDQFEAREKVCMAALSNLMS